MAAADLISSQWGSVVRHRDDIPTNGATIEASHFGIPSTLSTLKNETVKVKEQEVVAFDPDSLRAKYDSERDKRLAANPSGIGQYRGIDDGDPIFGHYLLDPYIKSKTEREPVHETTEVLIVGGGYGGQLVAVKLLGKGIKNFRIVEKGGDFGGTWYWNRYPGAQCDIESYVYMPLLDETGYVPTEKYARNDELLAHAKMIGQRWGLYEKTIFQTEIKSLTWDAETHLWVAKSDRGDIFKAQFAISAAGPLHRPKLPGVPGIDSFKGHSFHSSRWDYEYTGGDSRGNLSKLADKRVGIIGTGATAVQIVPHLGDWAKQVFVFQRTPSSIDVRGNKPTDPEWVKTLGDHWQKKRMDNFNILVNGGYAEEDLVADGWTDIIRNLLAQPSSDSGEDTSPEAIAKKRQLYDYKKMEQIRARVDSLVKDPQVAEKLKPYYNQFCKRPCFHDEYLQTFNKPNVKLIDTNGKGIEAITEKGVVVGGVEHELDCLIYATGFELATEWTHRSGFDITGEDGLLISQKWKDGASTLHGWSSRGFPNLFFVQIVQAALTPNFIHVTAEQAEHFAYVISTVKERKIARFQPQQEAEDKWVETIVELTKLREAFSRECTPGYYNDEGKLNSRTARNASYGAGALKFLELLKQWREDDKLEGLELVASD